MLKFQFGNSKLIKSTALFALPAGHSCPFAKDCHSQADKLTGKIIDGQHCQFRCFAAMEERYPSVRKSRWNNFELLKSAKTVEKLTKLIADSLPDTRLVRIHPSGDFFKETYFLAWINVAKNFPLVTFYAYTKALPFWVKYRDYIPANFKLVASKGGTHDWMIGHYHLRYAQVVFTEKAAIQMGLVIDHDDSLAFASNDSFALLLHGSQPKGTPAAAAWEKLRKAGHGYSPDKVKLKNELMQIHVTLKKGEVYLPLKKKTAQQDNKEILATL